MLKAFYRLKKALPFPLLGLDTDNGSEFVNKGIMKFCEVHDIRFTRSRPYKKNDSCFIEQKNNSIIRHSVGYFRYECTTHRQILRDLYRTLNLYTNFFQPVMKLVSKKRSGARTFRKYDTAKTPFLRLIQTPSVSEDVKNNVKQQYLTLNPAELRRTIDELQNKLILSRKNRSRKKLTGSRQRRERRVSNVSIERRRDDTRSLSNPFLEKTRFQIMKSHMEKVWAFQGSEDD